MFDNTDVSVGFMPLAALNQCISYLLYYAENCGKGGVFYRCVDEWKLEICGQAQSVVHCIRLKQIFSKTTQICKA